MNILLQKIKQDQLYPPSFCKELLILQPMFCLEKATF